MGARSLRFHKFQAQWRMGVPARKPHHGLKRWHCELLLSGSSTGKPRRSSSKSFQLQQREPVGLIADRFRSDVQLQEPAQSGWDH